jgi:hypothetical protein
MDQRQRYDGDGRKTDWRAAFVSQNDKQKSRRTISARKSDCMCVAIGRMFVAVSGKPLANEIDVACAILSTKAANVAPSYHQNGPTSLRRSGRPSRS